MTFKTDSNGKRKTNATHLKFDFLGFTFQPRQSINKQKGTFVGFLPAISQKAKNKIHETMRSWKLTTSRYLYSLVKLLNSLTLMYEIG